VLPYVVNNPVKARLLCLPEEWQWTAPGADAVLVAQIFNLLYRRFAICRRVRLFQQRGESGRLADRKSATRRSARFSICRIADLQSAARSTIPARKGERTPWQIANLRTARLKSALRLFMGTALVGGRCWAGVPAMLFAWRITFQFFGRHPRHRLPAPRPDS